MIEIRLRDVFRMSHGEFVDDDTSFPFYGCGAHVTRRGGDGVVAGGVDVCIGDVYKRCRFCGGV